MQQNRDSKRRKEPDRKKKIGGGMRRNKSGSKYKKKRRDRKRSSKVMKMIIYTRLVTRHTSPIQHMHMGQQRQMLYLKQRKTIHMKRLVPLFSNKEVMKRRTHMKHAKKYLLKTKENVLLLFMTIKRLGRMRSPLIQTR